MGIIFIPRPPMTQDRHCQKAQPIFSLAPKPPITQLSFPVPSFSTIASITSLNPTTQIQTQTQTPTQQDLTNINLLLPRLCLSDNLNTATHLTITTLLTNPPLHSLSLSPLPTRHGPAHVTPDPTPPPSAFPFLPHSHLHHAHCLLFQEKETQRGPQGVQLDGEACSPVVLDERVCGFCRSGMVLEALNVMMAMLGQSIVPGCGLRKWVYRGLLREARIGEALELNEALDCAGDGENGGNEGFRKVLALLDYMIGNWTE